MVFSSFTFLIYFLPAVLILYFIVPNNIKNFILLIASLLFYAWGEPVYIILMLLSITINFAVGKIVEGSLNSNDITAAKVYLVLAIIWNLFSIIVFKYTHLFIGSINSIIPGLLPKVQLTLPIGISFYTFQAMSYIVDVYRKEVIAQKSWVSFALYISMFPQLIAGPIVRYSDISEEIKNRKVTFVEFGRGCELFIQGLAKKVLLANTLGFMHSSIQNLSADNRSTMVLWLGAIAYSLQIYFDFSGYSDMAIGLGRMFGFHFNPNFDYPYIASSLTDFWRRWHISLSSWFKEYLYIPLGGNRNGTAKQIRNIMIVWILTGLWHGAEWNFVCWGIYYGVLLILEKFFFKFLTGKRIYRLITLILIMVGWVIFANTSFIDIILYLKGMFGIGEISFVDKSFIYYISTYLPLLVVGMICATPVVHNYRIWLAKKAPRLLVAINIFLVFLCFAALVYQSYNPFLYFRF